MDTRQATPRLQFCIFCLVHSSNYVTPLLVIRKQPNTPTCCCVRSSIKPVLFS